MHLNGLKALLTTLLFASVTLSACSGSDKKADAPGRYTVAISSASFTEQQQLAQPATMRIVVQNLGDKALPNVAISVDSFIRRSDQPGVNDRSKPVWVVDQGPRGGVTAFVNTWALGRLAPGKSKVFVWQLTPVFAGTRNVKFKVYGDLNADSKTELDNGQAAEGSFSVSISNKAPQTSVGKDGEVVREPSK